MSFQRSYAHLLKASFLSRGALSTFLLLWNCAAGIGGVTWAQVTPPITSSAGLNTQVSAPTILPNGKINYDITGGTRPGSGPNLFHSFGEFNVPTNNIANFLNETALPTSNILGRVTAGNPSNLFGTLQTTGFGNAHLFLMNPAGIVFGPNATLNVNGAVNFTTADYLRLTDGARFNAIPNAAADALLSAAPVGAFGFLGSNPAALTVQGSALSVPTGQAISLVAGSITVQAGTLENGTTQAAKLSAPGGQINVASVASQGEVLASNLQPGPNMTLGTVTLSQGTKLDVSGNAAGTVRIRGGQFVIADATISADTGNANGSPSAVDINLTGDLSIADTRGASAITARSTGSGNAGEVRISSTNLQANSTALPLFALIDSHTSGSGKAGNVSITAPGNLDVTGRPTGRLFFIDSGTIDLEGGHGGDLAITAGNIKLENARISTGDLIARNTFEEAAGSGGNATINADTLVMNLSLISTDGFFEGRAGDLTISARDIQMNRSSQLSLLEFEGGGKLTINADRLVADSSQLESETVFGPGGGITITGKVIELKNGTTVRSQTVGDGAAGDIRITATDHLTLSDDPTTLGAKTRPTGLFTNSLGDADLGNLGNGGAIVVNTPRLEMTGGARIDSTTQSSGRAGDVTITATDLISIAGERPTPVIEQEIFGLGSSRPSGIFTRTVGDEFCTGPCGDAGRVSITTGSLSLGSGAQINSGTSSTGQGGIITINATNTISISGTLSDGTPSGIFSRTVGTAPGSGKGGDMRITAGQSVTLENGSSITASSTAPPPGDAGNISINAGATLLMENSSVTTQAAQAGGGDISIKASDMVQLTNSQINTSVAGGAGGGGNITIDPNFVILQNSQILANAFAGPGGNITITTGVFLADASSLVDASSQFGLSGTVTIQSPTSNLSAVWARLQQNYTEAAALLRARCAAQVSGQYSSFVQAGRDAVPLEPGGWLLSPLALEGTAVAPPVAQELTAPALALAGVTLRGFDHDLSWPALSKTARRFHSVLDIGCGS